MRPAFKLSLPPVPRDLLQRRTIGITLAIIVHILAILLAWLMSSPIMVKKPDEEIKNFSMIPIFDRKIADKPKGKKAPEKKETMAAQPTPPRSEIVAPPSPLNMIMMSSTAFAASDISQIHSQRAEAPGGNPGADSDAGVGTGPDGAPLYNAEWYREPTRAEMDTYFPKNLNQSAWGMIICKTIPDYRVEDCRELAESPPGSGVARSLRQAAWQFRVRPPRRGGQPMIGAWVRIRYDLHVTEK